jgi:ATP-dependent RNA helicase DDX21
VSEQLPKASSQQQKKKRAKHGEEDVAAEEFLPSAKKLKTGKVLENGQVKENGLPAAVAEAFNPMAVSNFGISDVLREKLKSKGIESLFPIQAQTFDAVFSGNDLVGRARTGQGKTLAFVLPILESLTKTGQAQRQQRGRAPSVIVLAPTRELAKQVHADFEFYGNAVGLSTVCVYGGAPYGGQENAMRKGVDIVVGTPGRVKDFFERGTLNVKTLKFRVLDEADEMLNMGFVDDVELILGGVDDVTQVQTLLFSATMPDWVKKVYFPSFSYCISLQIFCLQLVYNSYSVHGSPLLRDQLGQSFEDLSLLGVWKMGGDFIHLLFGKQIAAKFLKPSRITVDLVGDEKMKASANVKHLLLPGHYTMRTQLVADVISCYGSGGRCIVFTETKNDATELAGALKLGTARALHGDIPQNQREVTLAAFRSGKFHTLVATDVAARGLDINDVQVVIQCEPPRDAETYIHRSGRTGRAGNTGISVMLYDRKKEYMIPQIERKAGFKFERIAPPQPADIAKASAETATGGVLEVADSVVPLFRPAAQELVKATGLPVIDLLAKALAKISGQTEIKRRSLLSSHDDATTLILKSGTSMYSPGSAFNYLREFLSEEVINEVRRMTLTVDSMSAVFDVPSRLEKQFTAEHDGGRFTIEVAETLPQLQVKVDRGGEDRRYAIYT